MNKVFIIGSGFSSLSSAAYLAKSGYDVTILEKNATVGGRARQIKKEGFTFDMGPTWYWMPDVFERFFSDFDKKPSDFYQLEKLSPAYQVYFDGGESITIPDNLEDIYNIFEKEEKSSAEKLKSFLNDAKYNYDVAIKDLVYKPGVSPLELVTPATITKVNQFVKTISQEIRKRFKSKKLIQILEFPVLFLGAKPSDTPAFYNFMNYADFVLGTWYPIGGMHSVAKGMMELCELLGVKFEFDCAVNKIETIDNKVRGLDTSKGFMLADIVLSGADYHHTESLLDVSERVYTETFWKKKTFAPSSILFYVGFNKRLENIEHHTLFFDQDFDEHAIEIYDKPSWPKKPLFYASFPSKTDLESAPEGYESAIFLIPLAPDLKDSDELKEKYFNLIIERLEKLTNQKVRENVIFKEVFSVDDFKKDYNSYKGNAYGMANTLFQTAFLRPKIKSKKVKNLYFTGQLTVPGPGVPPSLISGKIASDMIKKYHKINNYESII